MIKRIATFLAPAPLWALAYFAHSPLVAHGSSAAFKMAIGLWLLSALASFYATLVAVWGSK